MKTVRVRILVAVDADGGWICHGASGESDKEKRDCIFLENIKDGEIFHWIEADVPLPAEAGPEIEGIVTTDDVAPR